MKKLILIGALLIGTVWSNVCASAASCSIEFTSSPNMSQIKASVGDKETTPASKTLDGTSVWHIGSTTWSDENLYINIDDNMAKSFTQLNDIYVDVVYYDDEVPASTSSSMGFFEVKYKTPDGIERRTDTIICGGSKQFKTASLKLSQAVLNNGFNGSDFVITTRSLKYGYATKGINIKSVTVTSSGVKTPVRAELTTDSTGNIFFDSDENSAFKVSLQNFADNAQNANCILSVKDGDATVYTTSKNVSVPANGRKAFYMDYEPRIYGAYTAELIVKSDSGEYKIQRDFSYCRKPEVKNDRMGVAVHLSGDDRDSGRSMELTAKAGFASVRDEILWKDYEKTKNKYALTTAHIQMLNDARKNGVKVLVVLGFGNVKYTGKENGMPVTDEHRTAFCNYVRSLVTELESNYGDVIEAYELWNEPNHPTFNYNMTATGADYAALAKAVKGTFKNMGVTKKLIGLSMTGIHDSTCYSWCEAAYKAGAGQYLDAMSFHPYYLTHSPEAFDLSGKIDMMHSLADKYGGNRETWITEHGWSSINSISQEMQAKYTVRSFALSMTDTDFGKYYLYQLQDGGNLPNYREHQYGMLRKWCDTEVPYSAKKVYPAICNLNWLFGEKKWVATETIGNCTRYRFESTSKEKLHIIFSADETSNSYIPAPAPPNMTISAYDMYGNDLGINNDNYNTAITVTGEPVYVIYRWKKPELAPLNGWQDANFGAVTISTEKAEGATAEIAVLKGGKNFNDFKASPSDCVAYFNTVDVKDGCFSDSFYIKRFSGTMRVVVHYPDSGAYEYAEFNLENAHSCDITDGVISCRVDSADDYDAYYAEYNNGRLINVHKYTGQYTAEIGIEADCVKMFVWHKGTLKPIADVVEIERDGISESGVNILNSMRSEIGTDKKIDKTEVITWSETIKQ